MTFEQSERGQRARSGVVAHLVGGLFWGAADVVLLWFAQTRIERAYREWNATFQVPWWSFALFAVAFLAVGAVFGGMLLYARSADRRQGLALLLGGTVAHLLVTVVPWMALRGWWPEGIAMRVYQWGFWKSVQVATLVIVGVLAVNIGARLTER